MGGTQTSQNHWIKGSTTIKGLFFASEPDHCHRIRRKYKCLDHLITSCELLVLLVTQSRLDVQCWTVQLGVLQQTCDGSALEHQAHANGRKKTLLSEKVAPEHPTLPLSYMMWESQMLSLTVNQPCDECSLLTRNTHVSDSRLAPLRPP